MPIAPFPRLKRFLRSEAGATVLWVISSLALAAVILPWLYRAGMSLGHAASTRELPALLEWVGASAGRAKISRYFSRALVLAALLLLPLLFWHVRRIRTGALGSSCHRCRLSWPRGLAQIVVGCVISGGLLWLLGMALQHIGAYVVTPKEPGLGKIIRAVVVPAIAAATLEEWLFRGLLLGLWLRISKPLAACVGSSLLFAFVHFLEPPRGSMVVDPGQSLAGFELLGKIIFHFADPRFFVTDFATLFTAGLILAWARLRTGALWFPIGLHAGWILAFKGFNLLHRGVPEHAVHPWGLGDSLRSGLFPMLTLLVTAGTCHLALRAFEKRRIAS
jgi:membrane protease YdiL (CAAX protease family)